MDIYGIEGKGGRLMASEIIQPLNNKQLAFCQEYIIDFNQTQAAIRAGYSKRSAGAQANTLLKKPNIQAEIKRLNEKRAERTGITADRVVQQLAQIAFMDIKDVVTWGVREHERRVRSTVADGVTEDETVYTDHVPYIYPKEMGEVDGTLIQSMKLGKYGFEVQIPDRMRAFEMLSRHLGVYDEQPQATVDIAPYAAALKQAAQAVGLWEGFNNSSPDGGKDGQ